MEGKDPADKLKALETSDPTAKPSPMKMPRVEHSTPAKKSPSHASLPSAVSPTSGSGSDTSGNITGFRTPGASPSTIIDDDSGRGSAAKKLAGTKRKGRRGTNVNSEPAADTPSPVSTGTPTPARNVAVLEGAQAKPLSQFEANLNQEPVIESELQKSGTVYSQILPNELVFARWNDKNYYSGMVESKGLCDDYKIEFDDGIKGIASGGNIIPVRILGVGVNGTYCPDTHFETKEAVILGQKFQIDPEGGGGEANVKYAIQCEGDDTGPIWCSRRQLALKEPEAKRLRAGYASIAGGKPGALSIGNILSEPRHRPSRPTFQTVKERRSRKKVDLEESSTPKDEGRGRSKAKASPAAEANQEGSSEKTPETDKDSGTGTTASPASEMAGEEESPTGLLKLATSAMEPPGKEKLTKNLFQGVQFFLTGRASFSGAPEILGPPPPDAEVVPYNRAEYRELIEACGGELLEAVGNENEGKENVFLISDSYARTFKYLYSVAAGIPCVSFLWIKECVAQLELVDWKAYALPAGWSLEHQDIVERHVRKPLKGCKVFIPSELRPMADYYEPLVRAAEALLLKPSGNNEGRKIPTGTEVVVTEDPDITQEIVDEAYPLDVPIVKTEWMLQSIITGAKRENYDHEKYTIDYDEDDDEFMDGSVDAGKNNDHDHGNEALGNKQGPD